MSSFAADEEIVPDVNRVKVLVIDAQHTVRRLLRKSLARRGYIVIQASDGATGLDALSRDIDLVILDLQMPDLDGLDLLRSLRQKHHAAPIIILSAAYEEAFKVDALDAGATDYMTKPFSVGELLARIPKALRHGLQINGEQAAYAIDNLKVDLVSRSVFVNGNNVRFTPREFDLLRLFIKHQGEAINYTYILQQLWSPRTGRKYLHGTVRRLRAKIEAPPGQNILIESIPGVGYRLQAMRQRAGQGT